mgnify:FL=1
MNEVWLVILPLIAGYLLDLAFGDPRTIPHPVVGFGNMISWAERHFNCGRFRKWKGAVVALSFPLFAGMAGWGITVGTLAVGDWCFCIVASVFVFYGLANHSLIREGREVVDILKKQGVEAGRRRLSWIVGRDTSELSPKGIYTAVLETMAENLSDGVVAPLFYYALGGFPAMMAYKMVNTLDSMIGYKDERYRQFGCMAARLDDVLNYIPARLTALFMALVAYRPGLFRFIFRYCHQHASPNSAQTEAVCAGALQVQLAGDAYYFGKLYPKETIGDDVRPIEPEDILRAGNLMDGAALLTLLVFGLLKYCMILM